MTDPSFSRRDFLCELGVDLASLSAGQFFSTGRVLRVTDGLGLTSPFTGWSLYRDVVTYSNLGEHRTATDVDQTTAAWLERHLLDLGFQTERQVFSVPQSFVHRVTLLAGARGLLPIEAFPFWPATYTPQPISRPMAKFDPDALVTVADKIALVTFPYSITGLMTPEMLDQVDAAAAAGAVALVAITNGPTGELTALNPRGGRTILPIPVLLVGPKDRGSLEAAVRTGANVKFTMQGVNQPAASAVNIVGRWIKSAHAPWVVISTPYSGWFRCGGERGPGIAYWRALSRWVASRWSSGTSPPSMPFNYLFLATSGHELGQYGMTEFLQHLAPSPSSVPLWVHLGAWMASYAWSSPDGEGFPERLKVENSRFLIAPNLATETVAPLLRLPGIVQQTITLGEIDTILAAGYSRAAAITGRNVPHHTRLDTAVVTSPRMLEPTATALAEFIVGAEATAA